MESTFAEESAGTGLLDSIGEAPLSTGDTPAQEALNSVVAQQELNVCRVCRGPATDEQPLFYPCQCKGSIKYVHQECLIEWLAHSRVKQCELCKHKFQFTPVYAAGAPEQLSLVALLLGIYKRWGASLARLLRAALVLQVWLFLVPLLSALIARFYMGRSPVLEQLTSGIWLVKETMIGIGVVTGILVLYMSIIYLVRYMRSLRLERQVIQHAEGEARAMDALEDLVFDFLDAPPAEDEVDLDDLMGVDGPWYRVFSSSLYIVAFNAGVLALFLLLPSLIGSAAISLWKGERLVPLDGAADFYHRQNLLSLVVGYVSLSVLLLVLVLVSLLSSVRDAVVMRALRTTVDIAWTVLKVGVLLSVELVLFPLFAGLLMHEFALPLLTNNGDASSASDWSAVLSIRTVSISFLLVHWILGIAYMFLFGMLISTIRATLRPGMLWFLRNPETFNPIRDMIELSLYRHIRRLLVSVFLYTFIIWVQFAAPARVLRTAYGGTVVQLSLEFSEAYLSRWGYAVLVVLHLLSPYLLPLSKSALAALIRSFIHTSASCAGLHRYLIPEPSAHDAIPAANIRNFHLRLALLALCTCWSLFIFSLVALSPLLVGQQLFAILGFTELNDLFAFTCGFYIFASVYYCAKLVIYLRSVKLHDVWRWLTIAWNVSVVAAWWLGIIPLLAGLAIEHLLLPVRFNPLLSPAMTLANDWMLGLVYLKIWWRIVMHSPTSAWKLTFDEVIRDGFTGIRLHFVFSQVIFPIFNALCLFICIPYLLCAGLLPFIVSSMAMQSLCFQASYAVLLSLIGLIWSAGHVRRWLKQVHDEVRDEKYLVGCSLHNYEIATATTTTPTESPQS